MGDAARLLQNLNKLMTVYRITAELCVNVTPRMPQCPQCLRGHTRQFAALLHGQEGSEYEGGVAIEAVFTANGEPPPNDTEIVVDDLELICRRGEQAFFNRLQQNRVQLADHPGGPIVTLHQQFAGPSGLAGFEAVDFCQSRLQVKEQAVFTPSSQQVELDPQALEGEFGAPQRAKFSCSQPVIARNLSPGHSHAGRLSHPQHDLQVA